MSGGCTVGDASRWRALNLRAVSITARINVAESSRPMRLGSSRAGRDPVKANLQSRLPTACAAPLRCCRETAGRSCRSPRLPPRRSSPLRHRKERDPRRMFCTHLVSASISVRASGRPDGFLLICPSGNVQRGGIPSRLGPRPSEEHRLLGRAGHAGRAAGQRPHRRREDDAGRRAHPGAARWPPPAFQATDA